jgi:iron complex transport system permease protein
LGGAAFAVSVSVAWLDLTSFEQYVWFSFGGAVAATVHCLPDRRCRPGCCTPVWLTLAGVALDARTKASTPLARQAEHEDPRRGRFSASP